MNWYVQGERVWAILSPMYFRSDAHLPRLLIIDGSPVEAFYSHSAHSGRGRKIAAYPTVAEAVRQAPYDLLMGNVPTTSRAEAFLRDNLAEPDIFTEKE